MTQTNPPRVVIFAGPNGAGKSTHADANLAASCSNGCDSAVMLGQTLHLEARCRVEHLLHS